MCVTRAEVVRPGVGRAGIGADEVRVQRHGALQRLLAEPRAEHPGGGQDPDHWGLTPDSLTICPQRTVSFFTNSPNSSTPAVVVNIPCAAIFSLVSGAFSPRTVSALSLTTISRGVALGANSPNQVNASNPGNPDSDAVGNSAAVGTRCALVAAMPRSFPSRASGSPTGRLENTSEMWPPMASAIAGPSPLYGTNCMSTLA